MSYINPEVPFKELKKKTMDAIASHFPHEHGQKKLELKEIWVDDKYTADDYATQKKVKLRDGTWAVPVKAKIKLTDNKTGHTDTSTVTLAQLPRITDRWSYIVNGKEFQTGFQDRLKPGVYTRIMANGELESMLNFQQSAKRRRLKLFFDPEAHSFKANYGGSTNFNLVSLLSVAGVSSDKMKEAWGNKIYNDNIPKNPLQDINKWRKSIGLPKVETMEEAKVWASEWLKEATFDPKVTKKTLGKPFSYASGDALLASSKRLLSVARGDEKPDNRNSIEFANIHGLDDLVYEHVTQDNKFQIKNALNRRLSSPTVPDTVDGVFSADVFKKYVINAFKPQTFNLGRSPVQTNPLDMLSNHTVVTRMGKKGIETDQGVEDSARYLDESHLGFRDPIHTPESEKIGITLHLPIGVKKVGNTTYTPVYDRKTGKTVYIDPMEAASTNVVLPDQVKWQGDTPVPVEKEVKTWTKDGGIDVIPYTKADYVMKSPRALFDLSSNMIPFLMNDQGNRASMASRQQEQAVGLTHPEAPLIQSASEDPNTSFEEIFGQRFARHSPAAGIVQRVGKDGIVLKSHTGEKVRIPLYDEFPLNEDRMMIDSTPVVKAGDTVKKGQLLADTNFTKDGVFSIGRNLRIAYLPYKGYNFDDGIVLSESAAKKMSSDHLHKDQIEINEDVLLNKRRFLGESAPLTAEQEEKLDDDGIVREGVVLNPGDVVIGKLLRRDPTLEGKQISKAFRSEFKVDPIIWDGAGPATVSKVHKSPGKIKVYTRTSEPIQLGDKIVGRHANKGVVTKIVPDHEIPHTKDGLPIEVIMDPTGVHGRINPGQLLETAAAKVAFKLGKPIKIDSFGSPGKDKVEEVKELLRKNGFDPSGKEELIDPTTGRSLGKIFTGRQYILKQKHQVTKKLSARSGGFGSPYDINQSPKSGTGAQALDPLTLYGLLAHGAKANIREAHTYKGDMDEDFWVKLQAGDAIPPPKTPFVYTKFLAYLRGMGVDTVKEGNKMFLSPITDEQTRKTSGGALSDPGLMIRGKDLKPMTGGLFDLHITGGLNGTRWSHFDLQEPMPNPLFEKPIKDLTGLGANFGRALKGTYSEEGVTGPELIKKKLEAIDVDSTLSTLEEKVKTQHGPTRDKSVAKIRYLKALKNVKLKPAEAYIMQAVPVIPPVFRPITKANWEGYVADRPRAGKGAALEVYDLNKLYKGLALTNDGLKTLDPDSPDETKGALHDELYDGLKALQGFATQNRRVEKGILNIVVGKKPSHGFFQKNLIGRKQDMSMRSTIVPEPSLGLDEVGIPYKAALEMYKPFVIREMSLSGYTPLRARKLVDNDDPSVRTYLESIVKDRPVLLKRDPAIHKYNVMAFFPKLIGGSAVQVHPLVTGGFGADFDGDTMSAYVPVSDEAVGESRKMLPSNNLFSTTHGGVMYTPSNEAVQGLYELSKWGTRTNKKFGSYNEAAKEFNKGNLKATDVVIIGGKASTVGRHMMYKALPTAVADRLNVLHDKDKLMGNDRIKEAFTQTAKNHPNEFPTVVNAFKDLGNDYAYQSGFTIGLDDITPLKETRDPFLARLDSSIRMTLNNTILTSDQKNKRINAETDKILGAMDKAVRKELDTAKETNAINEMIRSGAKAKWASAKQILASPAIVRMADGSMVPQVIRNSYSEGLDVGDYFTAMHGSRKGSIERQMSVQDPGYMTKQIVASNIATMVTGNDCGTNKGIKLKTEDDSILNRHLAVDTRTGVSKFKKDTLITPEVMTKLRNNKVNSVVVRSPIRCEHGDGVCQKCMGVIETGTHPNIGDNIGVVASQAFGEPLVNMAMKAFHTGGVFEPGEVEAHDGGETYAGAEMQSAYGRVKSLLGMPQILKGSAILAKADGLVTRKSKDPAGGWNLFVGDERHYVPRDREVLANAGARIKKGQRISTGPINPHQLLPLVGPKAVQQNFAEDLFTTYKNEGVRIDRRHAEVVARNMMGYSKIDDPGDKPGWYIGDVVPFNEVLKWNEKGRAGGKPAKAQLLLRGKQTPLDMQEDWMAKLQFERLKETMVDAAAKGHVSLLHSPNPIPGMAYGTSFGEGTEDKPFFY